MPQHRPEMSTFLNEKLRQAAAAVAAGDHAGAERLSREILEQAPLQPHALAWLGIALAAQGRHAESVECFRRAVGAEPDNPGALLNLGNALQKIGEPHQAIRVLRQALTLQPAYPEALNSLGAAFAQQGNADEAIECYRKALELRPDYAEAHNNLGQVLLARDEGNEALACFRRAASLQPDNAEFHHDLGTALAEQSAREEAVEHYERALALNPGLVESQYSLAVLRVFRHEFELGWPGYESRLRSRDIRASIRKRATTVDWYERLPRWQGPGEATAGEVAVWGEQGLGDQILFSTLIPGLIEAQVPFVYEVDPRLAGAYERAFPGRRFVHYDEPPHEALWRASRVLLAGSLPGLFRRSRSDFARQPTRLLGALPARVAHYRKLLAQQGPELKVALSWWSSRKDHPGPRKSAPLMQFAPLLKLPGVQFVDVQYGDTLAERIAVEGATGVRMLRFDEVDYFNDLEELLAILEACDLVITTSNATAHFAGALGKRTWLLYLADQPPFFYWAHDGSHRCLWYPSVEIVTARDLADWPSLLQHVAERLRSMSGRHGSSPLLARQTSSPSRMPPSDPTDWRERAASLQREGRIEEAVHACRHAVEQAPGDARAWSELAHALRLEGSLDEARAAAARAIEIGPRLASAWFNWGAVLLAQDDAAQSIEANRKAIELDPDFAEAWSNLGGALAARGDRKGEIDAYRRALAVNPSLAPVWSNLGNALREAGEVAEAVSACRKAVALDPGFAGAWSNLGNALLESGEHEEALQSCQTALRLAPELAEAWSALGGALHAMRRYEEAISAHQRAIEIRPESADLQFNLGMTLQHCGRNAEAIPPLRRALELGPGHVEAHFELSLALLNTGRLREGWEEYEWRWRRSGAEPWRYDLALWGGNTSKPCRLLVWAEQGIGDEILYGGMVAELASSPLTLTLEVDRRLAPIYQRSFPRVAVVPRHASSAADPAAHDCQTPMASLGRWLRPTFESFPRRAFLKPDPLRVDEYRRHLAGGQAAVVGVSWRSANQEFGSFKSTELGDWLGILKVPHARFVDLQYGDTAGERESLERKGGVRIEHLPDLDLTEDLDGLAALCASCDLVVTVSNVTAHIAGAIGRPVWLIAPKGNGRLWYWFSGRSDSPWYPSMRIFDQVIPGRWRETLDAVARELATFVKAR